MEKNLKKQSETPLKKRMLTQLGDMAEIKGWALSVGREKPFNQGPAFFYVVS